MAKKVVGKIQSGNKQEMAKVIISLKSKRTGAYTFKETMVATEEVSKLLSKGPELTNTLLSLK